MPLSRRDFHSLLVCFATDTVTEHVASIDTQESPVTLNSHHLIQINSAKTVIRCVPSESKNPKFLTSTERKQRKRKVIPKFSTATWPFPQRAKWSLAPEWLLLSIIYFFVFFFSRCLVFRRNFDIFLYYEPLVNPFSFVIFLNLSSSHSILTL